MNHGGTPGPHSNPAFGSPSASDLVLWAADAFSDDPARLSGAARAALATFPNSRVLPVYVVNQRAAATPALAHASRAEAKARAEAALSRALTEAGVFRKSAGRLLAPYALVTRARGRAAGARKLMRYAERLGARAVATGTHGREGLQRLLLGSFAETLLGRASIPVFLVNPRCAVAGAYKKLVFATDFSPACRIEWRQALDLACELGVQVDLFYHQPEPLSSVAQTGSYALGGGWLSFDSFVDRDREREAREAEAAVWTDEAAERGVEAHMIVDNFRERTSDAIVDYLRTQDDALLALVSQTGGFAGALIAGLGGSVTRQLARAACCPIYAIPRTPRGLARLARQSARLFDLSV